MRPLRFIPLVVLLLIFAVAAGLWIWLTQEDGASYTRQKAAPVLPSDQAAEPSRRSNQRPSPTSINDHVEPEHIEHESLEYDDVSIQDPEAPAPDLGMSHPSEFQAAMAIIEHSTLLRREGSTARVAEATKQILFVHIEISGHEATLISANTRPGRPSRARVGESISLLAPSVVIEAVDANGVVVWNDAIQDPTVFRCCLPHAQEAGLLQGHVEILDSGSLTVRVPDLPGVEVLRLYRNPQPSPSLESVTVEANLIGSFDLR